MKKITIAALVILLLLSAAGCTNKTKQTQVYDVDSLSYTELESGMIYKASELVIVDSFAYQTYNNKTNVCYYLAVFYDSNGRLVAVNMPVYGSDDIYYELMNYSEDDSQVIGDCIVNCYVKASTYVSDKDEVDQYFQEAIATYSEVLGENMIPLDCAFYYHCGSTEDPLNQ